MNGRESKINIKDKMIQFGHPDFFLFLFYKKTMSMSCIISHSKLNCNDISTIEFVIIATNRL